MQKNCKNKGFSLIELLVVLVIVGSILGLVTFNMDSITPSSRIKAGARMMASTIALAHNQAVVRGRDVTVCYNIDKRTIQIILPPRKNGGEAEPLAPEDLPKNVVYEDILVSGARKQQKGWLKLKITPTGIVPGHVIHLKNEQEDQITVEVNPLSGAINILEGYQPLQFLEKP